MYLPEFKTIHYVILFTRRFDICTSFHLKSIILTGTRYSV